MELKEIMAKVVETYPDALAPMDAAAAHLAVTPERWREVALLLRDDPALRFDALMCLTGYDQGPGETLGVAYNLHSMKLLHKVEVRVAVPRESAVIPSVALVWRTADWHEREACEMFGIQFEGHPDPRHILLPDDWAGYPLRKDYATPETYRGMPVPKDKRGWE